MDITTRPELDIDTRLALRSTVELMLEAERRLQQLDLKAETEEENDDEDMVEDLFFADQALVRAMGTVAFAYADLPDDNFSMCGNSPTGRLVVLTPSYQRPGHWQLTHFERSAAVHSSRVIHDKQRAILTLLNDIELSTLDQPRVDIGVRH